MMKKNIKKILASAAALALLLGNFAGTGMTVVKADSREMPVYVTDEETGEPVADIYLMLESKSESAEDIIFDEPTDEDGYVLYEPLTLKSGVTYLLKPAEDSECTSEETIEVVGGRNYYGNFIKTVNGQNYTGEDIDLFVQDNRGEKPVVSEISSISSSIDKVNEDGGVAAITVNGKNLPEEVYCQLWYESAIGAQVQVSDEKVSMSGDGTQKKFDIDIPSYIQYPKAVKWIVRVSLDGGAQGWDSAVIDVVKEAK